MICAKMIALVVVVTALVACDRAPNTPAPPQRESKLIDAFGRAGSIPKIADHAFPAAPDTFLEHRFASEGIVFRGPPTWIVDYKPHQSTTDKPFITLNSPLTGSTDVYSENIIVIRKVLPAGATLQDFVYQTAQNSTREGATLEAGQYIRLHNKIAYRWTMTIRMVGQNLKVLGYAVQTGRNIHYIQFTATQAAFDSYEKEALQTIGSFTVSPP